jgi:hypothetical protein
MSSPLRAVVLDNDETTGSYAIVFAIAHVLQTAQWMNQAVVGRVLERLARWMIAQRVFRPGLRNFLASLVALREDNKIDAIIMYTNQLDQSSQSGSNMSKLEWCVPRCIAYMMECLVCRPVFDRILMRPEKNNVTVYGAIQKDFQRILQQYPNHPKDITRIRFIDDLAYNPFIIATGIPKQNTDPQSWVPILPYKRALSEKDIRDCVKWCFGAQKEEAALVHTVFTKYSQFAPKENSTPNAGIFMDLTAELQKLYGYARKNTIQSRPPLNEESPNVRVESKINGGEIEGEHDDTKSIKNFGNSGNRPRIQRT